MYNIDIEEYRGPMDLLLHLINKNEIDIYDIPVNRITEEFISHMEAMDLIDLDQASDFLYMASSLLELKSKLLLPKPELEEDQEDPRDDLVKRLVEYKRFKEISAILKDQELEASRVYFKPREEISPVKEDMGLEDLKLEDLIKSLQLIAKRKTLVRNSEPTDLIEREEFSLEDAKEVITNKLSKNKEFNFSDLISEETSIDQLVTYFLCILEMVKIKTIKIYQEEDFSDIRIFSKEVEANG